MTFDELFNSEIYIGTEQVGELERRLKQVVQPRYRHPMPPRDCHPIDNEGMSVEPLY